MPSADGVGEYGSESINAPTDSQKVMLTLRNVDGATTNPKRACLLVGDIGRATSEKPMEMRWRSPRSIPGRDSEDTGRSNNAHDAKTSGNGGASVSESEGRLAHNQRAECREVGIVARGEPDPMILQPDYVMLTSQSPHLSLQGHRRTRRLA